MEPDTEGVEGLDPSDQHSTTILDHRDLFTLSFTLHDSASVVRSPVSYSDPRRSVKGCRVQWFRPFPRRPGSSS